MHPDIGDAIPAFLAIQIAQRHGWNSHLVGIRARQKPQPENLKSVARGHAVQIFIHRADQNLIPEAPDGPLGLVLLAQPIEHRDSVQILAPPMLAEDGPKRAGDRELVGHPKKVQIQKASREVQRRGKPSGLQHRSSAAGLNKEKLLVKMDPIRHAQAPVEIHQIDAAAQQDMLAVVDYFRRIVRMRSVAWNRIRSGAAAQESPGLKKINLESGLAQRGGRRKAGQTSADHDRRWHSVILSRARQQAV